MLAKINSAALYGIDALRVEVEIDLARVRRGIYEQPRLLAGDRGMGKTAVLAELATRSRERGHWAVEVEASRTGNALALLLRDLRALLWDHDRDHRVGEYARRALSILSAFALVHPNLRLRVDIDAAPGRAEWCTAHLYNFIPGTYVMVASWYNGGMNVIDWSDPSNPQEIEHYWSEEANYWSAYWYRGRIYANDRRRGLDVFEVRGLRRR
jgi:hypothetical protein